MKRIGNIYPSIANIDNIELADRNARRGKHNRGIVLHDKHKEKDNLKLLNLLLTGTYNTSKYTTFKIFEPKERIIYRLPYYPDRITHWCIMLLLERIWNNIFISHTYSCIKKRGIHKLVKDLSKTLHKHKNLYCLKLDIHKFYPSIDHDILKEIVRKKIKDKQLLHLLYNIIDSADGVPIGNYLSLFFANLYLTYFDHWLLEEIGVKYYFRYADDIVILSDNKEWLHKVLILIKIYLHNILKLQLKPNYLIFPIASRGIDYVGYVFYTDHVLLRKSIKQNMLNKMTDIISMTSYLGWCKWCNSKHLLLKVEIYTGLHLSNWNGIKLGINHFKDKCVNIQEVIIHNKYVALHIVYKGKPYEIKSTNKKYYNTNLKGNIKL